MMNSKLPLALAATVLTGSLASAGTVLRYYVDGSSSSSGNGFSWATSFQHLQDALDEAETTLLGGCGCDIEIFVAAGTYRPDESLSSPSGNNDRFASFVLLDEVTIYGHFAGFETSHTERDLSNPAHETILSGDIGGPGNADNSYHVVDGSFAGDVPTSAILDGFTIRDGNADGTFSRQRGGGVYADFGRASFSNCTLEDNAASQGGAVANEGGSNLRFVNCRVRNNTATLGGAAYIDGATQTWYQAIFRQNTADEGGAVYQTDSTGNAILALLHSTLAGNTSLSTPGDDYRTVGVDGANFIYGEIRDTICWSEEPWSLDTDSSVDAMHIDLRGGVGGIDTAGSVTLNTSNVQDADPRFRNEAAGDLRIAMSSPCSGSGSGFVVPDVADLDGDGDRAEPLPFDIGGNARTVSVVDQGAHEALCEAASYCVSILNSSGGAAKIAAFGTCSSSAQDLHLEASPVPNAPGLFFFATSQIQVVFGNGLRCAGGVTKRLPVRFATGNTLRYTINWNSNAAAFLIPNSVWNFQAWFRDGAAGGAGFNTSDGVEVSFQN